MQKRNMIQTHSLSSKLRQLFILNFPFPYKLILHLHYTQRTIHQKLNKMIKTTFLPTRSHSLPVSQQPNSLRKRLSSSSSTSASSIAYSWTLQRSKSVSAAGSSIKKWWEMGWSWILSKKPGFARDLELNEHEKYFVGTQNKGTWMHVFYKVRGEFRRILGSDNEGLPLSFNHHHLHHSKSFRYY